MSPRPALLVIAVVFAILNADITTVNVALVTVGKDLHSELEDLQWGLNSYMLAFAALIVAAGRLADVFGRRRCLLVGSLVFAIASLICGIAPTLSVLVIGRILQGAGGALMLPAGMAIVSAAYGGNQRAVALGTLVGVAGVAQSIGPLVGGFLTAEISWRFVLQATRLLMDNFFGCGRSFVPMLASCLLGFVFFLFLYIAAVYLQEQLGYTAFAAGIALVPFSLALAFTGVMAGHLTNRFQLTSLLIASCVSMALGLATLSFLPGSILPVVIAVIVIVLMNDKLGTLKR